MGILFQNDVFIFKWGQIFYRAYFLFMQLSLDKTENIFKNFLSEVPRQILIDILFWSNQVL